ncbi:RsfS/YbeB/iojap family protein, partial [Escherichia coli]|nr:RsfS/YbeB/iojap family protein [Escherichia coli]
MLREELKDFLADKADDMKAEDIIVLNVEDKSSVTDYMIICTGTSKRHVSSIADHVA